MKKEEKTPPIPHIIELAAVTKCMSSALTDDDFQQMDIVIGI